MAIIKKYLGWGLIGLGVVLLVLHACCGLTANWLLVVALLLELAGLVIQFMPKRKVLIIIVLLSLFSSPALAQTHKVQNRPYTDLRPFHFGIHVGTHMQDLEFLQAGDEITADQDRLDPGFNVGVLGEFRLTDLFQFRVAPAVYFGSRHLSFYNAETLESKRQDLKAAYFLTSADLIFAAPRCNNHRVYLLAGLVPTINLTTSSSDYIKLKRYQMFTEIGVGLDRYLPYFKCRPELKFMFGLGNALAKDHAEELRDENMVQYTNSVSKATTKMITLSFYFE